MKNIVLCFLMLMATCSVVRASAITFEATVNSPRVALSEVMQLTLTFSGVTDNLDPINLPVLNGFSAKYLGPSTSVSIVNGDYHSERSFIYNLFPNKVGRFQIPSISATIGGQTYTTKPIDVEVFESSAGAQAAGGADQEQAPSAENLKDKILIMVSVDKTEVYLNERVALTIKLLVNDVPMRDIQFPQFEKKGFTVDDFEKPQQNSQIMNGIKYDAVEFKTYIYPNHLGDLPIGPVQIQGNVIYKTNQDNNPLGMDLFNNFFNSYAARPVTVTAQPIQVHVSSLPSENRPNDFSGAIGQSFDFQASVSPLKLKAGDPLTLKMDIKGSGNLKGFKIPVFQSSGFKTYEPQIKDGVDEKTAEEVIIPTSAGIKEVPALHFSYFDPSAKDYKTIVQGPFSIQVTSPGPDQEFKAIGFSDMAREASIPAGARFSFGKLWNTAHKVLQKLFGSILFWVGVGAIIAGAVSLYVWRRFQFRLENDPAFARRLKAVRDARKALVPAEEYISTGKNKDFYALLSRTLRAYLADKWHQSSAALSIEEILSHLRIAKLDESHVAQIKTILERSDLVCFAGATFDPGKMRADLAHAQDLITQFEKSLR